MVTIFVDHFRPAVFGSEIDMMLRMLGQAQLRKKLFVTQVTRIMGGRLFNRLAPCACFGTNMMVETRALLQGLNKCKDNVRSAIVEGGSLTTENLALIIMDFSHQKIYEQFYSENRDNSSVIHISCVRSSKDLERVDVVRHGAVEFVLYARYLNLGLVLLRLRLVLIGLILIARIESRMVEFNTMDAAIADLKARIQTFHEQLLWVVSTVKDIAVANSIINLKQQVKRSLETQLAAIQKSMPPMTTSTPSVLMDTTPWFKPDPPLMINPWTYWSPAPISPFKTDISTKDIWPANPDPPPKRVLPKTLHRWPTPATESASEPFRSPPRQKNKAPMVYSKPILDFTSKPPGPLKIGVEKPSSSVRPFASIGPYL
ncbi:hypothetical protein LguiA_025777 [Lonicera macranthoides]